MHIELTEQERFRAQQGEPVEVVDLETNEPYILIARQRFEQVCSMATPKVLTDELPEQVIPEGIRLSQVAFRHDLPILLKQKKLFHQWVAYHRNIRIGIARDGRKLREECYRRGLAEDEFFLGWIDACGLIEEEEVEPRPQHYVENDHEDF